MGGFMYKYIFIIVILVINNHVFANNLINRLDQRIQDANSLICVGLDPDINKIPANIAQLKISNEEKIYIFLIEIVKITSPHASAYKLQKAFFDQFENGHALLQKIVSYIHKHHKDILVFIDCKIGDTDNTMKVYMENIFGNILADGVVINPYMGDDVMEPFILDPNKLGIVLIQTSNPSAKIIQEIKLHNGKKLWEEILNILITKWNKNKNLIPVLSSNTKYLDYSLIRKSIPQDMPIFLAGVGSQGGNLKTLKQLLNDNNRGVLVNSSRGILYPYDPKENNWRQAVLQSVLELKNEINTIRGT